jgi:hypothetical protein
MDGFNFERDGWNNATDGQQYGTKALNDLTWENLGYRLGCLFGDTNPKLIDQLYDWCVEQQSETHG